MPKATDNPPPQGYLHQSTRPLVSLVFILPMLALYEGGIIVLGPKAVHNGAAVWLQNALSAIGLGQYILLPLATCGILLAWHHLSKQPWKFSPWVLLGMLVESLLWAMLLVLVLRGYTAIAGPLKGATALADVTGQTAQILGYFGAGIYEELLFRLILLSLIAAIVGAAGATKRASLITAILVSALIFAAAHYRIFSTSGREFALAAFIFLALCGIYFGGLFSLRGFGIAAGAHALYDIAVTLLL